MPEEKEMKLIIKKKKKVKRDGFSWWVIIKKKKTGGISYSGQVLNIGIGAENLENGYKKNALCVKV